MTEAEWLAATDPKPMLEFLRSEASDRKLRLFAVACCRYFFCRPHDGDAYAEENILSPVVGFADGELGASDLSAAEQTAFDLDDAPDHTSPKRYALIDLAGSPFEVRHVWDDLEEFTSSQNCDSGDLLTVGRSYLFDLFGNFFRPVTLDPSWLTPTVVALATGIYADKAFDRMPILADALQDAGCSQEDILNHCRQPGEHVRGCWVVDLILGKS